jgi:hypothetical protein
VPHYLFVPMKVGSIHQKNRISMRHVDAQLAVDERASERVKDFYAVQIPWVGSGVG